MFKIIGIALAVLVAIGALAAGYVKFVLPDIEEASYVTIERTPQRIERGKYLATHVAVCLDCHSKRQWNFYSGPMANEEIGGGGEVFNREMGFPGVFYAPNVTPYALGAWSDGEILRSITTGVDKDGKALFPLMAYHRFGRMAEEDVYSIVAYLRTLAPVEKNVPESEVDFPVSILINTMPAEADFQVLPDVKDKVQYGKYLANAAGCVDCHSKTDKGAVVAGTEFGGGMEFKQPAGIITSTNITFDKETGIGNWSKESFVARFKMYAGKDYKPVGVGKNDVNTPMPWTMYAGMKDSDLEAIYAYLKSIEPIKNEVVRVRKAGS